METLDGTLQISGNTLTLVYEVSDRLSQQFG